MAHRNYLLVCCRRPPAGPVMSHLILADIDQFTIDNAINTGCRTVEETLPAAVVPRGGNLGYRNRVHSITPGVEAGPKIERLVLTPIEQVLDRRVHECGRPSAGIRRGNHGGNLDIRRRLVGSRHRSLPCRHRAHQT